MCLFNPKFAALLVTVLLLSACTSSEKQPIADRSPEAAPSPSSNPIADATPAVPLGKAKATCGDALPKDEKAYPVSFYPVFVSYSDKNLELVKKHFCADAIKRRSEKLGKDVVQVGSFISKERASALRSELSAHLQGADVGEPSIIQGSRKDDSTQSVSKAARLSSQQASELKDIVGIEKDFQIYPVVVLPTDVPDGFKVAHFAVWKQKHPSARYQGGHYEVLYENDRGNCFTINGGVIQPLGDPPITYERILNLSSPALGNVEIGITGSDRAKTKSFLGFTNSMNRINRGRNEYLFESPPGSIQTGTGYQPISGCSRMDEKDAIRVVQSMQFISP